MGRSVEIVAGDSDLHVMYKKAFYFLYFVDILPINKSGSSKTFEFFRTKFIN